MLLDLMKTYGLKANTEEQLESCQTSKMECFEKRLQKFAECSENTLF